MIRGDYTVLKAELQKPEFNGTSAAAAAATLNAPIATTAPVPMAKVLTWGSKCGVMPKLQAHAASATDPLQSAALGILAGMNGGLAELDLQDPDVAAMFEAFHGVGDFSDAQRDAFLALAAGPATSRALQLAGWALPVSDQDVTAARST